MNKWRLSFSDSILEENYQCQQIMIQYPLFVMLSLSSSILMIVYIGHSILYGNNQLALVYGILLGFTIIQWLAVYYYRNCVACGLLFFSVTHIVVSLTIAKPIEVQNLELEAFILLSMYGMVMCVQDIKYVVIQIIVTSALMATYFTAQGYTTSPLLLIAAFWTNLVMVYFTYKSQQQRRQFYLLSQKDGKIRTILDKVVQRKVVIFDLDEQCFKYRTIYSNQVELKEILKSQMGSQLLSEYLYQRVLQRSTTLNQFQSQNLTLRSKGKLINVNLNEFYYEQKTFMIIVNEIHQSEKVQELQNIVSVYLRININLLIKIIKSHSNLKSIQRHMLFVNLMTLKRFLYIKSQCFSIVNLNQLIRRYLNFLNLGNKQILFQANEIYCIDTIEPLLSMILIEILYQFRNYSRSLCRIVRVQNFIDIQVLTNDNFIPITSSYREEALDKVIHKFDQVQNGYIIRIQIEPDP